jgi:hypothetical protein
MSIPEIWNLDISLAKHIADRLRAFSIESRGYPDTYTPEGWKEKIQSIVIRLERYSERLDMPSQELENEVVKAGQEALRDFADIFPALWD